MSSVSSVSSVSTVAAPPAGTGGGDGVSGSGSGVSGRGGTGDASRFPSMWTPRAAWLTSALRHPSGTGPGTTEPLPEDVARDVARILAAAARRGPAHPVRVDAFFLSRMGPGGAGPAEDGPFRWSPGNARRSLGLAGLRAVLAGSARTPAQGVRAGAGELVAQARMGSGGPGSLGGWLAGLRPGARAAVLAQATTWATRLYGALDWDALPGACLGPPDRWWSCPGAPWVHLRARADVRIPLASRPDPPDGGAAEHPGDRPAPTALLTVLGGLPGKAAPAQLGLAALVEHLARPRATGAVTVAGWWPDAGRALVLPVTRDLLLETAEAVAGALERPAATAGVLAVALPDSARPGD